MKKLFRGNKILRQFSGVQRDVDLGINGVKEIQHAHVQIEIVDRQVRVLWHNEIQADDARVFRRHLKAGKNLGEDHFFWETASHLIKITGLNVAAMIGLGLAAAEFFLLFLFGIVEKLAGVGHDLGKAAGQKLLTQFAEIIVPSQGRAKACRSASIRVEHCFQVLQTARRGAGSGFRQHLSGVTVGGGTKLAEGGKEMVVTGFSAGNKLSHGERVQQVAVKSTVLQGDGGWRLAAGGIARRWRERKSYTIDAQAILDSKSDKAFRIDRAGKMIVKIATLWHLLQESVQKQRLVANRIKISGGLLLG
jgi:hypothetical protein